MIHQPATDGEWLKVREVADMLNLPLSSTYLLVSSGELPFTRISRRTIRIAKDAVLEYVRHRAGGDAQ